MFLWRKMKISFGLSRPWPHLCLALLWYGRCKVVANSSINVEVVTLGNIHPNVPGAIPFTGPGLETATEELQRVYGNVFNITHAYIFDRRYPNCVELATGSDDLLGTWFYNNTRRSTTMTVFIFAGKTNPFSPT
jgi:hypothetical protein